MHKCACGKLFNSNRKKYCSYECYVKYSRHNRKYYEMERQETPINAGDTIIRDFDCRTCGKHVAVIDKSDKRTVYCSAKCEKKYWRDVTRHPSNRHNAASNLGMSGGMSLGSLIKRETRDLKG